MENVVRNLPHWRISLLSLWHMTCQEYREKDSAPAGRNPVRGHARGVSLSSLPESEGTVNPSDVLVVIDRAGEQLETLLRRSSKDLSPALGVAQCLRMNWPGAVLSACLLCSKGEHQFAALDEKGRPDAVWSQRLDPATFPTGTEPAAGWRAHFTGQGMSGIVREVEANGFGNGLLALLLAPETNETEAALAGLFLVHLSRTLALRFALETVRRSAEEMREELLDLSRLANVGELAGPLAHEFTNFLNVLLLQASVLEFQLPEQYRADLAEIRRQGNLAAAAVHRFHQYRRDQFSAGRENEINPLVLEVANELAADPPVPIPVVLVPSSHPPGVTIPHSVALSLHLAPESPRVRGPVGDLRRLVRFLVTNAVRAALQTDHQVWVDTHLEPGRVVLRVEDSGPTLPAEELLHVFDLSSPGREGVDVLELAACRSLVQRLNGTITAQSRPDAGLSICAEFPQGTH
jgi:signal transduction histidine kinase